MEVYTFSKGVGKNVTQYTSNFIMTRILQAEDVTKIGCMHLGES